MRWGKVGLGRATGVSHNEARYALITSLAPLSWTLYTIIGKDLVRKRSVLIVTHLSLIFGTLPFLFVLNGQFFETLSQMNVTHWIALFYLCGLCTVVGFWIRVTALQHMPATSVALFSYI